VHNEREKDMSSVLVLNAGYEPLHRVSLRHAIKMIVREVAVVEEAHEEEKFGDFPVPLVLRLVRYVKLSWRKIAPRWSKRRLFERDNHACGYCGKEATTVDHIVPRSQGGGTTWLNTAASCFRCNSRKGNRTPQEAGMHLLITPHEPSWSQIRV
jgi:5-methylcytosine-specific restriction endonuclease McrA